MSGATSFASRSQRAVVLERVVGVDPALHADLGRAELDRLADPLGELVLVELVGVGRALALAEAAERAADGADVGEVDVAVDDERRDVAGELGPQLVGGLRASPRSPPAASRRTARPARPRSAPRPSRPFSIARGARSADRRPPSLRRPEPRRGMKLQYLRLITSSTPCSIHSRFHVLRVDAEALGQRVAARRAAPCAPGAGSGTGARARCGRRWRRGRRGRSRRPSTRSSHQSERFGGIWTPTSGISRRHSATSRLMSSSVTGEAHAGHVGAPRRPSVIPAAPSAARAAASAISATSAPVVARVRDEVLEDHLLDVAVAAVDLGQRLERRDPLLLGLADPDEDPARERDPQLAGGLDRLPGAPRGCFVGDPAWTVSISRSLTDSSISPCEAVTSRRRARSSARATPMFVCGSIPRSSARSQAQADVGGEVLVAPRAQPLGDDRVDLGPLAGQHQQLLDVPPQRLVEAPLDLVRGVDVRLVGRERAVLAVAPAGPRQRQRQVAREGDAAHAVQATGPARRTRPRRARAPGAPDRRRLSSASRACRRDRSCPAAVSELLVGSPAAITKR